MPVDITPALLEALASGSGGLVLSVGVEIAVTEPGGAASTHCARIGSVTVPLAPLVEGPDGVDGWFSLVPDGGVAGAAGGPEFVASIAALAQVQLRCAAQFAHNRAARCGGGAPAAGDAGADVAVADDSGGLEEA